MSRILGIDFGTSRIGLAVSDPTRLIAQPIGFVSNKDPEKALNVIKTHCDEWNAVLILVGNPLKMDGSEGFAVDAVQRFVSSLKTVLETPIVVWDERLSSAFAEKLLISGGVRRKKRRKKIDAIAAVIILQSYLDYLKNQETNSIS
jgi:putative pre-16S rRNA nuclease